MKLSSALPLVVALSLSAPANSAMAGGSQIRSGGFNRVHFDLRNGKLHLRRPDKLSSVEREEAIVEALYGFRGLVDDCLENGTSGDTKVGPHEEKFTVNCGAGGPMVSCTFEGSADPRHAIRQGRHELRTVCRDANDREVRLDSTVKSDIRYTEPAAAACHNRDGCAQLTTQTEISFSGTNIGKIRRGGRKGRMTFVSTIVETIGGITEVTSGPDSFGEKRKYYIEAVVALHHFLLDMKEQFLGKIRSKNPSTHRPAEGLLAADLRKPGLFDLSAQ